MSGLPSTQIHHLALLARLEMSDEEVESLAGELSEIVNYVTLLSEVDTEGVVPTSQTTGLVYVLRSDAISTTDILSQAEATSATEKIHNFSFIVPAVLDKSQ